MKKRFFFSVVYFLTALAFFVLYINKQKPTLLVKPHLRQVVPTIASVNITPLSLEKIFFEDKKYLSQLAQNELITIISTGDIIPARMVNMKAIENHDFTWSFKNVWETLVNADLTAANLEAPLMKSCVPTSKGMTFCGSSNHIEGLKKAGIDLVSLANNHSDNYGNSGLLETTNLLTTNNIMYTGVGEIKYKTIKNIRFAFLGYNFLLNQGLEKIAKEVTAAKNNADFVVVFPHWGEEYEEVPSAFETNTQKFLLDSGADLILGNHPHIIQPLALNNNRLTVFAHGNFIFDQEWSPETKKGMVMKFYIYKGKIIDVEVMPVIIQNYGQPQMASGKEKDLMLKNLYRLSRIYETNSQ